MALDLGDALQSNLYYGLHEKPERDLVTSLLSPGAVFFDLGAHVGYYTIAAARLVGPLGQVHAFEPLPSNAALLQMSCQANGFKNIRLNRIAVSDTTGQVTLQVPNPTTHGREASGFPTIMGFFQGVDSITVATTSIDEYVEAHHLQRIDLIKMDIEAAEVLALCGMVKTLTTLQPRILCEVNVVRLKDSKLEADAIHRTLFQLGYEAYEVTGHTLKKQVSPPTEGIANYLFVPSSDPLLGDFEAISFSALSARKQGRQHG
ncbi:MAG: FkbM family methyltransferase [Anaerolineae bacterium]|nr:FkbM family methyltransferase [Anaerolineae bacterium]